MNRTSVLVIVVLAAALLYAEDRRESNQDGYYKLVAAEVMVEVDADGGQMPAHTVFLLNTRTGDAWRYEPTTSAKTADGREVRSREAFYPVGLMPTPTGRVK